MDVLYHGIADLSIKIMNKGFMQTKKAPVQGELPQNANEKSPLCWSRMADPMELPRSTNKNGPLVQRGLSAKRSGADWGIV